MDARELIARHPQIFHIADAGAWSSIRRHGLLSTTALLDRFGIREPARSRIEAEIRPDSVVLSDRKLGTACIRDNRPLRRDILARCLDIAVGDWCRLLNRRVFFWTTAKRVQRLLAARGHRDQPREIIVVDTARLLERHGPRVTLSPINSGSALYPNAPVRGPNTFEPVADFPYDYWRAKRSASTAVVELCTDYAVPDIESVTLRVDRVDRGDAWPDLTPPGRRAL
jgi:hypothetical protein